MNRRKRSPTARRVCAQIEAEMETLTSEQINRVVNFIEFFVWRRQRVGQAPLQVVLVAPKRDGSQVE